MGGIVGNALAMGFGQGLTAAGDALERDAARDDQQAERRALLRERLEEQRAETLARIAASSAGRGGGGGDPMATKFAGAVDPTTTYGINNTPTDREAFTTNVPTRTDPSEYSDAVSRKTAPLIDRAMFDKAGFDSAEGARTQRNIDITTQVLDPGSFEGQQKGLQEQLVNRMARLYEKAPDEKTREWLKREMADITNSTGSGDRFKEGGGTILNQATGESSPTEVGRSTIRENNAQASAAGSGAKSETLKALREERVAATTSLAEASRNLSALRALGDKQTSKTREKYAADLAEAEAEVKRYRAQADTLAQRIQEFTTESIKKNGPAIKPVTDNAKEKVLVWDPKTRTFK